MSGERARHDDVHLHRLRAPLRTGRRRRARGGDHDAVRGPSRRSSSLAAGGHSLPAECHPHPRRRPDLPRARRQLPVGGAARGAVHPPCRRRWTGRRRAPCQRAPHARPAAGDLARCPRLPRRPGVRRRRLTGGGASDRTSSRTARCARRGRRRLRGVHVVVRGVVATGGRAMGDVGRAERDDLRRPRRHRRLEHLDGMGRRDPGRALVGGPHHRGDDVVLDLPAPRESLTERDRGRRVARPAPRCRRRRAGAPDVGVRVRGADADPGWLPVQLPPSLR